MDRPLRAYVDTSVIGGCLDEEFADASSAFLEKARQGQLILVLSSLLADELRGAPEPVKEVVDGLPPFCLQRVIVTPEAIALRDRYLAAGILTASRADDALHVALATVAQVDLIVSWNFKHLVRFDRVRQFNAVNLFHGYPIIDIRSPREVG